MEEEKPSCALPVNSTQYCNSARIMSSEIVEIGDDSRSIASSRDGGCFLDVYVAVGKDDLHVLKWALDRAVSPGTRVFLVHVFPPITYIPTPVGRLSRSQLSQDQVRFYINEEHNRRRSILQKYIRLCNDAKVTVDTMLIESNETAKAILDLIPVLNITNLVMGTTRPPRSRLLRKRLAKAEFVKKNAPDYCEVTVVHDEKKIAESKEVVHSSLSSSTRRPDITRNSDRKFFECVCFSSRFNSKISFYK
ncbi:U-box domain-containing protein 33 [Ricinus communis]|uniref:U-box domain-containing protein 33 n=1 Tax=Ricinus communis TaxID=3988 RepID=UPI000D687DEF|nr:U-box domain-containing protein 33 [Ricinus communis]|eukprot:XP_025014538.1 U-box domain-containing protein 33 [Ricinus communis]